MTGLNPYPEYRNTAVPFLGEIPAGWQVQPVVTLARVLTSTVDKHSVVGEAIVRLCNYTDVYYNDVITGASEYMVATASREQISSYSVTAGDVVFTKDSETADDIGISSYVPHTIPGLVYGYHLSTYRPHDPRYGKFLKWLLDSKYAKATLQTRTLGVTRVGLSQNTVRYLRIPTPSPAEASFIAAFLDRETASIDAFIADQEELIGLLAERRVATISHAVTKGLDPSALTKDSGVAWWGRLPSNWTIKRIKEIVSTPVTDGPHETPEILDAGVLFVSAEAVGSGSLNLDRARGYISEEDNLRFAKKYRPQRDDIYMVKSGATTGVVAIVDTDAVFNIWSPLAAIRCGALAHPKFVLYVMKSGQFREAVELHWSFGTQQNIGMGVIENLPLPLPPIDEQRRIAEYLSYETSELDGAVADAREAITLSRERRAALISAAVTGKIDVRNAA